MTSSQTEHPSAEQLQAFVLGTLSLAEVATIEGHLTDCLDCQGSLEQVVSKDPFVWQRAQADASAQRQMPDSRISEGTPVLSANEEGRAVPSGTRTHLEIDAEALRFRVDLMSHIGPNIEERLLSFVEEARAELLRRLLIVEMEECLRANLPVPVDDYLRRFPDASLIESAYEQAISRLAREATAAKPLTQMFPKPFDAVGRFRDYLYQSKIGEGGMGAVYKALHTRLERTVAFKVLTPDKMSSPEMIMRFHREMKSVGKLEHPNIVRAHDAGDYQGCHFLVMEFVDGVPLDLLLRYHGPLPVREACEIIRQAAIGLDCAHRQGLVHRDVKPSNLMIAGVGMNRPAICAASDAVLPAPRPPSMTSSQIPLPASGTSQPTPSTIDRTATPDTDSMIHNAMETMVVEGEGSSANAPTVTVSRSSLDLESQFATLPDSAEPPAALSVRTMAPTVKVLDLGLARLQSESQELTHESQVVGTLDYIAPEQARRGGNVDHRADIYSLGCTLFTLLAGRAPFGDASHASIAQKVMAHVQEPLPSLAQIRPDVPQRLIEILNLMTDKQPSRRYQSASAVAEALAPLAQGANLRLLNDVGDKLPKAFFLADSQVPLAAGTTINLTVRPVRRGLVASLAALLIVLTVGFVLRGTLWERVGNSDTRSVADGAPPATLSPARDGVDREGTSPLIAESYELQFEPATHIKVPSLILDPTGSHTQEAWVTPAVSEIKNPIHVLGRPQGSSLFLDDSSGGWAFGLSLEDGFRHVASNPIQRHQRTHVAVVRANREMRLFVNGKLASRRDESGLPLMSPPKPFSIGGLFTGAMDEIHISSVARYEQDFTPKTRFEPDARTLALYRCDERSGVVLQDSSGNDHHGQINGPASWREVGSAPTATALTIAKLSPSELLASPDYEWLPVEELGEPINTTAYEAGASLAADGLSILFQANEARPKRGGKLKLWQAWRHTIEEPFQTPVLLESVLNDQPDDLSDPTITADGLTLAFCMKGSDSHGACDLWISDRPSGDASWSAPVNAGPAVNSDRDEWEPELSADGLILLFHSGRSNDNGGTDLWVARRDSRDKPFGPAENLGPEVNTDGNEGGAALSSDGLTLFFHRFAADATGELTHWQATRQSVSDSFGKPRPLIVPGLIENRGVSLSLSAAGDWLYCSIAPRDTSPQIGVSHRVPKRKAPSRSK